jgi:hypothetical protein
MAHIQCCQGTEISAEYTKGAEKHSVRPEKSEAAFLPKGPNSFASSRSFWFIWQKLFEIRWQH